MSCAWICKERELSVAHVVIRDKAVHVCTFWCAQSGKCLQGLADMLGPRITEHQCGHLLQTNAFIFLVIQRSLYRGLEECIIRSPPKL